MLKLHSTIGLLIATSLIAFAGCGAGDQTSDDSSGDSTAVVSLNPLLALPLPVGQTQQFSASAFSTSGTGMDVDTGVTWESTNPSVATVDENGLVNAESEGATTIKASYNGVTSPGTALVVTSAVLESISLSIGNLSLASGLSLPITVTGHFSDGSTKELTAGVEFSIDDDETASVSALGLVTGLATGSVSVTASYGAFEESIDLDITSAALQGISIQVGSLSVAAGLTLPIQVIAQFSDGSSSVLTDGYTVSISGAGSLVSGALSALTSGTATINASYGDFDADAVEVTISSAILNSLSLELDAGTLPLGLTTHVKVFGHYSDDTVVELTSGVTLGSSNTAHATVSASGLVTALGVGSANITASFGGKSTSLGVSVSSAVLDSITLAPATSLTAGLPLGLTAQLVVTGHYSDSSTQVLSAGVSFTSLTAALGSVTSGGVIKSLATGSASVKATYGGKEATYGWSATTKILDHITAVPGATHLSLIGGVLTTTITVTAHYSDTTTAIVPGGTTGLSFSSSNGGLLSVLLSGLVTALGIGSDIVVTATYNGETAPAAAITVTLLP